MSDTPSLLSADPLWFKDAIIYEVPARAFCDSNGDGIGDFQGLTEKLDYIRDLGVTAIWVLPFFPSPLRDDGYDISGYTEVNPIFGSLEDFQEMLDEAHQRGIRVIIELVINHTSDKHPWFQRARKAPAGSKWRNFYVWSDTPEKYREARIIFKDFETSNWTWDAVAGAYYWHRFYSHQPDLNYESLDVQEAVFEVVDYWLEMGVDGLRIDAVPYLYERDGTNCENLPETHVFLKKLRSHVDSKFENRMLLAEANQWPEDAVAYYGKGDECHMDFHFPLMPRLFMALRMEDSFPIIDIMQQTPSIPDNCQWALFLRNHDELTLEMVSDEDRDYMYRVYAQDPEARINLGIRRRLAPLLGGNRLSIELMNGLLLSLPGTPVLYYGDEIGMGDNIYLGDRNGVRTPMQWSADRNAGFSRANPQKLFLPVVVDPEYHYEAVNVEAQRSNPHSLWWWMKRLIATRKRFQAFGRGTCEFLHPENRKVLAFLRSYQGEHILVVANLSRFAQAVELDLSAFRGMTPIEIFGRAEFPAITDDGTYFLSLGPHSFYWFALQVPGDLEFAPGQPVGVGSAVPRKQHDLAIPSAQWEGLFQPELLPNLLAILPGFLQTCRWFGGKARTIQVTDIIELIPISGGPVDAQVAFVRVEYNEGDPEIYVLPIAFATGETANRIQADAPKAVIARLKLKGKSDPGILYDAMNDRDFLALPLSAIANKRKFKGKSGELVAQTTHIFTELSKQVEGSLDPHLLRGEQSNTSVLYGERFILKLFRKIEEGTNPDLEIGRFLTQQQAFENFAPVAGSLEYRRRQAEPMTVGILQAYVPNLGDAWRYTLDTLRDYFEQQVMIHHSDLEEVPLLPLTPIQATEAEISDLAYEMIGSYLVSAQLLGQRTAEMHLALNSNTEDPSFFPEAFSSFYQRSIYQSMRNLSGQVLPLLRKQLKKMEDPQRELAQEVLNAKDRILGRFRFVLDQKISAMRSRCHGDYHLGQVLYTGRDFVIIDFEGEPARALSERRLKRSPLRDVAGMLQSFYYASVTALRYEQESGLVDEDRLPLMEQWAYYWFCWVGVAFVKAYLDKAKEGEFLPQTQQELQVLLEAYVLEKVLYELAYELNNRPDWVGIPLRRILQLLEITGMSYWKPKLI